MEMLGIHFCYNVHITQELNFDAMLKFLKGDLE